MNRHVSSAIPPKKILGLPEFFLKCLLIFPQFRAVLGIIHIESATVIKAYETHKVKLFLHVNMHWSVSN